MNCSTIKRRKNAVLLFLLLHASLGAVFAEGVAKKKISKPIAKSRPDANVPYLNQLPAGNQALLRQLGRLGLSSNWKAGQVAKRDTRNEIGNVLTGAEKLAWESLQRRFLLRENTGGEWKKYWKQVRWQPKGAPVIKLKVRDATPSLLKFPAPKSSKRFAESYAAVLPGDVVLLTKGTAVAAIYWGNRKFPGRNYETSFFYFAHESLQSLGNAKSNASGTAFDFSDAGSVIIAGTTFNSYPARLTPSIFEILLQNKAETGGFLESLDATVSKKLKTNSKIFKGAGGYLSSYQRHAYGGYFVASKEWKSGSPYFYILRRKTPLRQSLVIHLDRYKTFLKNPKGTNKNVKQGGTLGKYSIKKNGKEVAKGYMLEAAGPDSKTKKSDQRLPAGTYRIIKNPGSKKKGDFRLVLLDKAAAKLQFGTRSLCNIHSGNEPRDIEGCLAPGTSAYETRYEHSYPWVKDSKIAYKKIKALIQGTTTEKKTTYDGGAPKDGGGTYSNSTLYDAAIIISNSGG